ncbi:hypothetical protein PAXINDRAFT_19454 [Paxillus involutus ATCC 200175]|uniref:Uncharacterized protein n=1 Tax=Paxillus involutus ATCC 200175 TaxID=664439 RepID=A0A0C9SWU0_PAXIN|nr:hypothetical protein PAXINDRAFT_19454 [Paxillus involutus ATCC 200175]
MTPAYTRIVARVLLRVASRESVAWSITCSVQSMVTFFVSIFRYKAEIVRAVTQEEKGHDALGLTNQHQRRGIMLSLPLVFLAYSVAGFITGVVIHSFRSAIINLASAGSPIAAKFDEYMDMAAHEIF